MGRKPKPTRLKIVTGNPGKRRLNGKEPQPERVLPSPPEHMSPLALTAWERFSAVLDGMGVLTEADGAALERLCELYVEIVKLDSLIVETGRTYETINESGARMIRPNPLVAQLADADRRFRGYLTDFGLSPSARVRVQLIDNDRAKRNPAASYFG